MLVLSKANKFSTTSGGLQKTIKWELACTPSLAKTSAHWLTSW